LPQFPPCLALALLMLGVGAYYHHYACSLDDAALGAARLD